MAVPKYHEFMQPLLEAASQRELPLREAVPLLGAAFGLSEEQLDARAPSGSQALLYNRVSWAGTYLVKAGLLHRPKRGVYAITDDGRQALESKQTIDPQFLRRFESFRAFQSSTAGSSCNDDARDTHDAPQDSGETPRERIDSAYKEIQSALRGDILDRVRELDARPFEQLIVDLMIGMGYGAGGAGRRIGQSGDGGVDGVISEDKLGLDVVYLQAKRYSASNSVGSPDIRNFIGSLAIRRATKGVFVTTSRFSDSAVREAGQSGHRIILIDGERLSDLMIQYDVGVRVASVVRLKEIDLNYFEDF